MPPSDSRVECIPFRPSETECPVDLFFRRGVRSREGLPVLLLHGASASCDTFLEPVGASLFDFLNIESGMDVWMLDWRGSHYVAEAQPTAANESIDVVARIDIPAAVDFILAKRGVDQLSILGHCLGAACLAASIGGGKLASDKIRRVVFATIALFYEVAWDGWAKTQDRTLDRVAVENPGVELISPDVATQPWPTIIEATYALWPKLWTSPWTGDHQFFQRLAFMFGQPFLVSNLHEQMTRARVRQQFGAIPFKLYQHAAQNVLRGFAAEFDAEGQLDETTENSDIGAVVAKTYMNSSPFQRLDVTLITGADNPLWHRDSIDLMAEWLMRVRPARKHVLPGCGHQDLWWGRTSRRDVFPLVFRGLN